MARVLFDLDSTGAFFLGPVINIVNGMRAQFGDGPQITALDIRDWNMRVGFSEAEQKAIHTLWKSPGYFRNLEIFPGFAECVRWVKDAGHEPMIVTAAKLPHALTEKAEWCAEHLPFLGPDDLACMEHKHWIDADVMVDDSPKQVRRYRETHPEALIPLPLAHLQRGGRRHLHQDQRVHGHGELLGQRPVGAPEALRLQAANPALLRDWSTVRDTWAFR
jgi:5'(3')-deoxyribonucleotidase